VTLGEGRKNNRRLATSLTLQNHDPDFGYFPAKRFLSMQIANATPPGFDDLAK